MKNSSTHYNRHKEVEETVLENLIGEYQPFLDMKLQILEMLSDEKHTANAKANYLIGTLYGIHRSKIDHELQREKELKPHEKATYIDVHGKALEKLKEICEENLAVYKGMADIDESSPETEESLSMGGGDQARLMWNGQSNSLINIFYQLKRITTKDKKVLLDCTNEQIVHLLKANFDCLKDTSPTTIMRQLTKSKPPKKSLATITV